MRCGVAAWRACDCDLRVSCEIFSFGDTLTGRHQHAVKCNCMCICKTGRHTTTATHVTLLGAERWRVGLVSGARTISLDPGRPDRRVPSRGVMPGPTRRQSQSHTRHNTQSRSPHLRAPRPRFALHTIYASSDDRRHSVHLLPSATRRGTCAAGPTSCRVSQRIGTSRVAVLAACIRTRSPKSARRAR